MVSPHHNINKKIPTVDNSEIVFYLIDRNMEVIDRKQVERIAKYLFQIFGFNSTFAKGSTGKEEDLAKVEWY